MTNLEIDVPAEGRFIAEEEQTAVWLLGGLAQVRLPGDATRDSFTVVEHAGERGYTTPLHVHDVEDEVFIVLDGTLRMVVGDREQIAESGDTMVIRRTVPHGFIALSDTIRFLTIHSTPVEGDRPYFDRFLDAEIPHATARTLPPDDAPTVALDHIISLGDRYGYGFAGPPPTLRNEDVPCS